MAKTIAPTPSANPMTAMGCIPESQTEAYSRGFPSARPGGRSMGPCAAPAGSRSSTWSLPIYSLGPGPARDVEPLIHVSGHPAYPSRGRFVMTSVEFSQLTALGALLAWLDPNRAVVPSDELFS